MSQPESILWHYSGLAYSLKPAWVWIPGEGFGEESIGAGNCCEEFGVEMLREMPDRSIRFRALLCHGVTLLWMPLAIGLAGMGMQWQLTQIMFMASLSLATDGGYSPSFAVTVWLVVLVVLSQGFCLSMPLVICSGCRKAHGLLHKSSQSAFNFQLSSLLYLVFALVLVASYDRAGGGAVDRDWVSWLIPLVVGVLVIWNGMFSVIGMVRAWRGEPTRYPLAIPFIR